MKKLLTVMLMLSITGAATAQNSTGKNKVAPHNGQKGQADYIVELKDLKTRNADTANAAQGGSKLNYGPIIKIKPKGGK